MRLLLVLLFMFPAIISAQAPSYLDGEWEGAIDIQGQQLGFSVMFSSGDGITDGVLNIPQQMAFNLPVEVTFLETDSLSFELQTGSGAAIFSSRFDSPPADNFSGTFSQAGHTFPFSITRKDAPDKSDEAELSERSITIELESHKIAGTLSEPEDASRSALVIFASGSGSQERDSNVAGFPVFRELAKVLTEHGYFTFRFDDRGTGGSTGETDATLNELAHDIEEVARYFKTKYEQEFKQTILLGHSQGGITSAIAAKQILTDGVVLMGAPALRGDKIIDQQILKISEARGVPEDIVEQNLEFQSRLYGVVRSGEGWEKIEKELADRLHEQIDELPEPQREALGDMEDFVQSQINRQLEAAKTRWFRSFIELDPADYLRELDTPLLAMFGEKDTQVLSGPNREALEKIDRQSATEVIEIPGANHLFQVADTGMPDEYGNLDREFSEEFIEELVRWLNSITD